MPRSRSADDRAAQVVGRRVGRPAGLAGDLARLHRHQRALVRADLVDQLEQAGPRIPLDVELDVVPPRRQVRRNAWTSAGVM
jgi:hypothetical protein